MNSKPAPTNARKSFGDVAPKLAELSDEVLFGDVWERAELSKRDRSLATCAALIALGKAEQMDFHFPRAIENGVLMELKRSGSQPSIQGPADYFTGIVRIDPLFDAREPGRTSGGSVTFEPGARSAWHTHPLGQTLIVTAGCGIVQCEGELARLIRPGDIVRCPPGEKHWHGATPTTAMTHIAIQEALDGRAVDWLEKVTEEECESAVDSLE